MHTLKFLHEALTKSNLFCGYAEQVLANLGLARSHSISQDAHTRASMNTEQRQRKERRSRIPSHVCIEHGPILANPTLVSKLH